MNQGIKALVAGTAALGLATAWLFWSEGRDIEQLDFAIESTGKTDTVADRATDSAPGDAPISKSSEPPSAYAIPAAPVEADPTAVTAATIDSEADRAYRAARSAASAGALREVADRYRSEGDTALADDLESLAYQFCGGIDTFTAPYPVTEWALVDLALWCEDYPASLAAEEFRNGSLAGANTVALLDRYPAIVAMTPSERAVEIARLAASAETPGELHAIGQIIDNLSTAGPSRSVFLDTAGLSELVDFQASQRTALALLECRKFGGCGPGDPLTLEHCIFTGVCERSWSREEAQRNLLTPVEWEIALSILSLLERSGAAEP